MKTMRNYTYMLLFCLPVLFLACKEDDEPTPEEMLIGTWNLSEQDFDIFLDDEPVPEVLYPTFGINPDSLLIFPEETTVEFRADKSLFVDTPDEDGTGTWSLSSDAKTLTITTTGADPVNFSVETLTSSTAVILFSESQDIERDGGGTINVRLDLQATFTKVN